MGPEVRYSPIEKVCLALIICHSKVVALSPAPAHQIDLQTDLLKYILDRSTFNHQLTKCAVLLQQYDIEYVPQKAIKGQALVTS